MSPTMCVSHELCNLVTNLFESQNTCESRTLNNPRLRKYVTNYVCMSRTKFISYESIYESQYICESRTLNDPRLRL